MLAAAEDLAAMERPEDAGTGGAQASKGGRPRAAARPAPSAKWTGSLHERFGQNLDILFTSPCNQDWGALVLAGRWSWR